MKNDIVVIDHDWIIQGKDTPVLFRGLFLSVEECIRIARTQWIKRPEVESIYIPAAGITITKPRT